MSAVGIKLRAMLEERKLSTVELERIAGLKSGVVRNITSGRSKNPKIETLKLICKALECSLYDVIDQEVLKHAAEANPIKENTNELDRFEQTAPWKHSLFIQCTDTVQHYLKEHKVNVKFSQVINLIKHSYVYALQKNKGEVSHGFTEWLVERIKDKLPY
jgi:DNA-binding Xre family transcriptional regulator